MFVDYYAVLETDEFATQDEIKTAFKKQAIRWHPDRNLGNDTTRQMQLINEAYLILKDSEARNRFDKEYQIFKAYKLSSEEQLNKENEDSNARSKKPSDTTDKYEFEDYTAKDDILKRWMHNAKRQAVDLAKETIKEFAVLTFVGIKEGTKEILIQTAIGMFLLVLFALFKGC